MRTLLRIVGPCRSSSGNEGALAGTLIGTLVGFFLVGTLIGAFLVGAFVKARVGGKTCTRGITSRFLFIFNARVGFFFLRDTLLDSVDNFARHGSNLCQTVSGSRDVLLKIIVLIVHIGLRPLKAFIIVGFLWQLDGDLLFGGGGGLWWCEFFIRGEIVSLDFDGGGSFP